MAVPAQEGGGKVGLVSEMGLVGLGVGNWKVDDEVGGAVGNSWYSCTNLSIVA